MAREEVPGRMQRTTIVLSINRMENKTADA
jgi:hypothetical protein